MKNIYTLQLCKVSSFKLSANGYKLEFVMTSSHNCNIKLFMMFAFDKSVYTAAVIVEKALIKHFCNSCHCRCTCTSNPIKALSVQYHAVSYSSILHLSHSIKIKRKNSLISVVSSHYIAIKFLEYVVFFLRKLLSRCGKRNLRGFKINQNGSY